MTALGDGRGVGRPGLLRELAIGLGGVAMVVAVCGCNRGEVAAPGPCTDTVYRVDPAEVPPEVGYSAEAAVDAVLASYTAPLTWRDGETTTMEVSLSPAWGGSSHVKVRADDLGLREELGYMYCAEIVFRARLTLRTADGLLDEEVETDVVSRGPTLIETDYPFARLDLATLRGGFDASAYAEVPSDGGSLVVRVSFTDEDGMGEATYAWSRERAGAIFMIPADPPSSGRAVPPPPSFDAANQVASW